ncbi:MAG: WYL domain-containing protein [Nocardioidaceae bacterium]|nr:WYL domain-containing protein [Nocardioidaceae bacterium]MCL2614627.1 WYL domain-containing protein [Nocardioidaceae bacterium]
MSSRPAAGARDQVARLLTLVPFLHNRDQVRLAEAAELLGSTPEAVLGDLRVLFMCGLPGGLPDDLIDVDLDAIETDEGSARTDGVIRIDNADYLARPMRLSPTEASAVIVALHTLREGSPADVRALVDRVLGKIEAAVNVRPALMTHPGEAARVALAARLQQAADDRRQVRLRYHVPARDEVSERVVDPYGVVDSGPFAYLDAWCHSAGGDRLFRLDRVERADVLDTPITTMFRPPRPLDDGPFDESTGDSGTVVRIRLAPAACWALGYYPMRDVRRLPDGSAEAELVVADPRWLLRLLLRLAPHAEVLSPTEFAADLTARARETLTLYS